MLCRAVRRVLNKGSFAEIDAKPRIAECFYSKKALTQLSHGGGGREKQLRSSTQIVRGECETVLSPVLPAHSFAWHLGKEFVALLVCSPPFILLKSG